MEIDGKDYLVWLHEVRKKNWEEEKNSGLSDAEWLKKITKEAEEIIGKKIPKFEKSFLNINDIE